MKKHYPRLTPSGIFKGSFKGNRKTKKGAINSKIINNPILSFSITPFLDFNNPVFSFSGSQKSAASPLFMRLPRLGKF